MILKVRDGFGGMRLKQKTLQPSMKTWELLQLAVISHLAYQYVVFTFWLKGANCKLRSTQSCIIGGNFFHIKYYQMFLLQANQMIIELIY